MQPVSNFYPLLNTPLNFVITMHQKPDGDAMGSTLGLYHFLLKLGHTATVISPTNWASFLDWMPGANKVVDFDKNKDSSKQLIANADYVFCLDFNILHRTKNMEEVLKTTAAKNILIDHHEQPEQTQFAYGISIPAKSSTCEMVFDFIVNSGHENLIDENIAPCLYVGVMTDTGSFRFPATTPNVHLMVARLLQTGIKHTEIHSNIYDNFLESRLRFIGYVLSNKLEVFYEYNTAVINVTSQELKRFNITTGDTEGLVNYPLSIQGIRMAAIVIDRDEERKWSFRSKGNFDVNTFARKYFSGGGHFNAAGGSSKKSIPETLQDFYKAIEENKQELE
jgi:bifunctional oligoribonuclease and PAP phosphatase NrnA